MTDAFGPRLHIVRRSVDPANIEADNTTRFPWRTKRLEVLNEGNNDLLLFFTEKDYLLAGVPGGAGTDQFKRIMPMIPWTPPLEATQLWWRSPDGPTSFELVAFDRY